MPKGFSSPYTKDFSKITNEQVRIRPEFFLMFNLTWSLSPKEPA